MKKTSNSIEILLLILVLLIALVGILGWSTGELLFARFSLLYIPMAPATASSFVVLIISLFFVLKYSYKKYALRLAVLFASSVIVLGSIVLTRFLFDFNWDIENIFLRNPDTFEEVPIGRMSPLTAGLFILYGISVLLLVDTQRKRRIKEAIYSVIVISSLYISTILLIGYLYKAPLLYGMSIIPVALPTAICFLLFGFALFSYMEFNFLFFINSISSVEKKLTRILIPLALFVVIIYGFINTTLHQKTENQTILAALLLIITIPFTIFVVFLISKVLGKSIYVAEQAVVESENKLKDLFRYMNEGFALHEIITDESGKPIDYKYLEINPAFSRMTGLERDQVIGRKVRDIFPGIENDPAKWIEKFGNVALKGTELTFEDYSQAVGSWFIAHAFCPKKGQFAVTFSDITDRKKLDLKLIESEKKFQELFENMIEGFAICELLTDEAGKPSDYRYLKVNPEFGKILGLEHDEVIGKTLLEVFPGIENDEANWIDRFGEVVLTGKQISFEDYSENEDKWFLVQAFRPQSGQFAFTFTDITDRKKASIELENSENKFRALVEQSLTGIYIFEKEKFLYVNKRFCEIFGYTEAEIMSSLKPTDVVTPDEKSRAVKNINDRLSGKTDSVHYIASGNHKDGRTLWIEIHGTHIHLDAKDVITGTVLDITDRKLSEEKIRLLNEDLESKVSNRTVELEKKSKDLKDSQSALLNIVEDLNEKTFLLEESAIKLENANKELESFTYSVSHDLKAPLRGIDGYSKLLLDLYKPSLNEEARTFIDTIRKSTLQMNQLIEDLLNYSRLDRSQLGMEQIKIRDLIESVVSKYNTDLVDSNFKVEIDVADIEIVADSKGLTIALRNLIENAIKFSKSSTDPLIQINVKEQDSSNIICIRDNGVGFDMQYHQKIYDIFQRLHKVDDFPGTGIGLAMVMKAMKRMHGNVWAESTPGKGASFYLEIPKKQ